MLKVCFRAMRDAALAQKAHRELKRACRQRKRAQLLSGLQTMEEAAKNGDSKAFYGFARLVSPKPYMPKIKLRDEHGSMLTRAQEGEMLHEYAVELFAGKPHALPPLLPLPAEHFGQQAWQWALHKIKRGKSRAEGHGTDCDLTGMVWNGIRAACQDLSGHIVQQ